MGKYISKKNLEKVKEIDLLTYLQNYNDDMLVRVSRDTYTTKDHSSLKISNGMWHWWTQGVGGKSALDYLIKVEGYEFLDAAHHIYNLITQNPPTINQQYEYGNTTKFKLPERERYSEKAIDYLHSKRCIDPEIIAYCVYTGLIYESKQYHNVVFVGRDINNQPRYASLRGIQDKPFHGEVNGSDKRYSFSLSMNLDNKTLHIFESAIDLLSYATILKMRGYNWKDNNLLSLGGVYVNDVGKTTNPLALDEYLKNYPHIERIVTHLDNDTVGKKATEMIMKLYLDKYEIIDKPIMNGECKDINETLITLTKGVHVIKKCNIHEISK